MNYMMPKIPRSTSKAEYKDKIRRLRVMKSKNKHTVAETRRMFAKYPTSSIAITMAERLCNPPIVIINWESL